MFKKILIALAIIPFILGIAYAKERQGEMTMEITIDAPEGSKDVRLWVPYPASDNEQFIEDVKVEGNYTSSKVYDQKQYSGDKALYAEWTKPEKTRFLTLTFKAKAVERSKKDFPSKEVKIPAEIKQYLKSSKFIPTSGRIKEIALNITKGKKGILQKAEAVYDWVIENTFRNPDIKGCGTGEVERILSEKGGKCADISGVYVALARAAGVPAREIWGLRLGKKQVEDMTGGHHCWAEFYLPSYGWVPVDPADVRKAMLVEKLELSDPKTKEYRDYYFGAVDENRIVLTRGEKGYYLKPAPKVMPLPYGFMYPYAEIDGKPVDWLAGQKELKYKITFRQGESDQVSAEEPKRDIAGETVTIAGDPCSVPLAKKLGEAFAKKTGAKIDVSSFGCTMGVYKAADGEADIGVSTQNGLSENLPQGAVNTVIAKSPIILIANKTNPVNNLTYKQVQGILSGKIKNWKDVGGKDMEIKNVMLMPCVAHTMSKQVALYGEDVKRLYPDKKGNPSLDTNKLVAENEGAIGEQIYGYESNDVKALTVEGLLPDEKTLPVKYTFYQNYNVVTSGESTGAIKEFIKFALSEEGKSIITSMKHIPINPKAGL